MDRGEKADLVSKLKGLYESHKYVFVVNTSGFKSNSSNGLRRKFAELQSEAVVAKNTLNKIAVSGTNHDSISSFLKGQNMSIFANDPVSVAKIIAQFSSEEKSGMKIVGVSDGKSFYDSNYVQQLSTMPSMDVVRAKLLSVLQSIPSSIVHSLLYTPNAIARVVSNNFKQ
jgi:large subunit ribosomal protein L10